MASKGGQKSYKESTFQYAPRSNFSWRNPEEEEEGPSSLWRYPGGRSCSRKTSYCPSQSFNPYLADQRPSEDEDEDYDDEDEDEDFEDEDEDEDEEDNEDEDNEDYDEDEDNEDDDDEEGEEEERSSTSRSYSGAVKYGRDWY
jgi:hypothetical protein